MAIKVEPWMDEMVDRLVRKMKQRIERIHLRDDDVFNESMFNAYGILEQRGLIWGDGMIHVEFDYGYLWGGDHVTIMPSDEMMLRRLLWAKHGHGQYLYGDDGELQCKYCGIDFKRNSVSEIVGMFATTDMDALLDWARKEKEEKGNAEQTE